MNVKVPVLSKLQPLTSYRDLLDGIQLVGVSLLLPGLNDNWYVCLLSSLYNRSQSYGQSAANLTRTRLRLVRSEHRWKAWRQQSIWLPWM